MRRWTVLATGVAISAVLGGVLVVRSGRAEAPQHTLPPAQHGGVVVGLCDGETTTEVQGLKEGQTLSRGEAQRVSDDLMAEWRRKNPQAHWDDAPVQLAQAGEGAPAAAQRTQGEGGDRAAQGETAGGAGGMPSGPQGPVQEGQTYGAFSDRDEAIWKAATDRFVEEGRRVFHNADELGGTVGISCDMCHPDAANTHPETYPKYQVQFGRVALLRDMINWCIQNPVRGRPLHDDDPKLKAMEAYILAQRKGAALDYGKH